MAVGTWRQTDDLPKVLSERGLVAVADLPRDLGHRPARQLKHLSGASDTDVLAVLGRLEPGRPVEATQERALLEACAFGYRRERHMAGAIRLQPVLHAKHGGVAVVQPRS